MSTRILLIDTQRASRALLQQMLQKQGFAVEVVADDHAASMYIEQQRPDLVLLQRSPGQPWDPAEVEILRSHHDARDIPLVLLSEGLESEGVAKALDSGVQDVWANAMSAEELAARIRSHLRTFSEIHRLREQACIDDLTGIFNRRGILAALERETNRLSRNGTPLGLLLIDVDAFKHINDTYGHCTGDQVLCDIGRVLRQSIRSTDAAGRLGGDEFLVVLAGVDDEQAHQVADRIRNDLERVRIGQSRKHVRVSIGIAVTAGRSSSSKVLLDRADASMYRDKRESDSSSAHHHHHHHAKA